jgi:crotonobetaine/carnitine-CoA ligase
VFGRELPGLQVRLVDDEDRDVADGTPGEMIIRHSAETPRQDFFSGYLDDRRATEQAWRGGWFHTGDIVTRDAEGLLRFVDRRRNIIRRAGENIAALEVEAALAEHPAVAQVAVIAAPDPVRDEEVFACIVLKDQRVASLELARSIQDRCLERLAYFKAPGYVAFIDALPTTSTNKVQKAKLADFAFDPKLRFDLRSRKRRPQ